MSSRKSLSKQQRTTFARTDITTTASGLFRIPPRGKPRASSTFVEVEHNGWLVTYSSPWKLGPEDLQVFLVLCALAGLDGKLLSSSSSDQLQLWDRFLATGSASKSDALRIRTTGYAVLREMGQPSGGRNYKVLRESLERLSTVMQNFRKGTRSASGARLLSYALDEDSGELAVAISPHMAKAILGESAQYVRVSLVEMRALENQASVLLQALFSSRIRPGGKARYHLDTLSEHVYSDIDEPSPSVIRRRRQHIRSALSLIMKRTSWRIASFPNNVVLVERVTRAELEQWERDREVTLLGDFPSDELDTLD